MKKFSDNTDSLQPLTMTGVRRILVIKLRHIGDVLLTVPVFRALKDHFPDADITALVNPGTEAMLSGHPLIKEVIALDRQGKGWKRVQRQMGFALRLRQQRFDMVVDLTGGDRPAILGFISGARYRIGWEAKKGFFGKRHLYNRMHRPQYSDHTVLKNLSIVNACGIDTDDLRVDFHFADTDADRLEQHLRNLAPNGDQKPIIHVHPASRWLFKCWNDRAMAEVIETLLRRGAIVVVTSSPVKAELERTRKVMDLVDPTLAPDMIDLSGQTSLKQLGAIAARADLFLGVDSAPMHIAAAVNTPVIALFGPTGAFNWGPWDNQRCATDAPRNPYPLRRGDQASGHHQVLQADWDCVPCGKDGCDGSKVSQCLEQLPVERVLAAVERTLEQAGFKTGSD